jgi:hypothetical protein
VNSERETVKEDEERREKRDAPFPKQLYPSVKDSHAPKY